MSLDIGTPLHDRVIVERAEAQDMRGSLYIPDAARERPQEGVVLVVGSGKRDSEGVRIPLDISEGDRILFGKYAGSEVTLFGKEYLLLREEEILIRLPPRVVDIFKVTAA